MDLLQPLSTWVQFAVNKERKLPTAARQPPTSTTTTTTTSSTTAAITAPIQTTTATTANPEMDKIMGMLKNFMAAQKKPGQDFYCDNHGPNYSHNTSSCRGMAKGATVRGGRGGRGDGNGRGRGHGYGTNKPKQPMTPIVQ